LIDWNLVARIAGGGFGVTIFVLAILSLLSWLMGLGMQTAAKRGKKEGDTKKG